MRLSIIIPCYNIADYVEECLSSVDKQIIDKYQHHVEVIVINDGSNDNTLTVIEKFISTTSNRFILIDQENQGLSMARNNALEIATGDYLAFLDGDDIWFANTLENILSAVQSQKADIIELDACRFSGLSVQFDHKIYANYFANTRNSTITEIKQAAFTLGMWFAWSRVFSKEIWGNHRFPRNRCYEDMYVIPQIYIQANSITRIDSVCYGYRVNPQSITSMPHVRHLDDLQVLLEQISEELSALAQEQTLVRQLKYNQLFNGLLVYMSILFHFPNNNNAQNFFGYTLKQLYQNNLWQKQPYYLRLKLKYAKYFNLFKKLYIYFRGWF